MANTKSSEAAISPKATPVKRTAAPKKAPKSTTADSGSESHYKMIQDAAYFIAERNNFVGDPQAFWLEAEVQISGLLSR